MLPRGRLEYACLVSTLHGMNEGYYYYYTLL